MRPPVEKSPGDVRQKLEFVSNFFLDTHFDFEFFNIFKIKWPKSEEKLHFWGRWVWVPVNPLPPLKLGGGSLEYQQLIRDNPAPVSQPEG